MKTLEYFKGAVDAIIKYETSEGIYIKEEKEFEYNVFERGPNGWAVELKCIESYKEPKFQGDWHQPADDDIPVYHEQVIYFTYDTSIPKVIKEIIEELNTISNLSTPQLVF